MAALKHAGFSAECLDSSDYLSKTAAPDVLILFFDRQNIHALLRYIANKNNSKALRMAVIDFNDIRTKAAIATTPMNAILYKPIQMQALLKRLKELSGPINNASSGKPGFSASDIPEHLRPMLQEKAPQKYLHFERDFVEMKLRKAGATVVQSKTAIHPDVYLTAQFLENEAQKDLERDKDMFEVSIDESEIRKQAETEEIQDSWFDSSENLSSVFKSEERHAPRLIIRRADSFTRLNGEDADDSSDAGPDRHDADSAEDEEEADRRQLAWGIEQYQKRHGEELPPEVWRAQTLARLKMESSAKEAKRNRQLKLIILALVVVLVVVLVIKLLDRNNPNCPEPVTAQLSQELVATSQDSAKDLQPEAVVVQAEAGHEEASVRLQDSAPALPSSGHPDVQAAVPAVAPEPPAANLVESNRPQQDTRAAIIQPQETVKKQPQDAQAVKKQPQDAQAVKKQPQDAQAVKKQPQDAQAVKKQPQDAQAVKKQPQDAQVVKKQQEAARPKNSSFNARGDSGVYADLTSARQLIQKRDYAGAHQILDPLLQNHSNNATIQLLMGQLYARENNIAQAIAFFQKAESAHAQKASYWKERASLHKRAGQWDQANDALEHAIAIVGENTAEGQSLIRQLSY